MYSARFDGATKWQDIPEHWLAIEILSRSSRTYDREFKRDAYVALGVREVWIVDPWRESIEICQARGHGETVTTQFTWRVAELGVSVEIDVPAVFAGLG